MSDAKGFQFNLDEEIASQQQEQKLAEATSEIDAAMRERELDMQAARLRMEESRRKPMCDMCGKPRDSHGYCTARCDDDDKE